MKRGSAGFTLLEVMVAVAILGLALAAIFSSEAGAIKIAHRSRKMGVASLLARCKMAEIQQQVAEEGLPALFDSDRDECCEDAEVEGFQCEWEINPIILPDNMFGSDEEPFSPEGEGAEGPLGGPGLDPASMQPEDILAGGNLGDLGGMAMQFAFPVLKPSFESQIRRATVTVQWKEGSVDHSFDVTQYLVADQPIELTPEEAEALGGGGSLGPEQEKE